MGVWFFPAYRISIDFSLLIALLLYLKLPNCILLVITLFVITGALSVTDNRVFVPSDTFISKFAYFSVSPPVFLPPWDDVRWYLQLCLLALRPAMQCDKLQWEAQLIMQSPMPFLHAQKALLSAMMPLPSVHCMVFALPPVQMMSGPWKVIQQGPRKVVQFGDKP